MAGWSSGNPPAMQNPLWCETLMDLWDHRAAWPRLVPLPALILLVTGLLDMLSIRLSGGYGGYVMSSLTLMVGIIAALAILAVRWHRLSILGEAPGQGAGWRRPAQYALDWIVIGVILGLMLGIPTVALFWLLDRADMVLLRLPPWLPALEVLINALIIFLFARLAMRLPHFAVRSELVGLRASWRATSGQTRPLAVASLMAGVAQTLVFSLPIWLEGAVLGDDVPWPYPLGLDLAQVGLSTLTELAVILVGASLLTQLYRRTVLHAG